MTEQTFSKKNIQILTRYIERVSSTLMIGKIQIKITRYHTSENDPFEKLKKYRNSLCCWEWNENDTLTYYCSITYLFISLETFGDLSKN